MTELAKFSCFRVYGPGRGRGQYPAILIEQAWLIMDIIYGVNLMGG